MIISDQVWLYSCLNSWVGFCELFPDVPVGLKGFLEVHTFFVGFGWSGTILCKLPCREGQDWRETFWAVPVCSSQHQRALPRLWEQCEFPQQGAGSASPGDISSTQRPAWLSWRWPREEHLRCSMICVMGELQALLPLRGAPGAAWLCGPAGRRAPGAGLWGHPLQEVALGWPRMGLWAVGTPSAGGGSKVAPRFPGWGSRLPWDCLWHTFSIRMISKAQIPRAYQSLTGQIALPTKLNIAFYLIILGKPSPQQEAITAGD